MSKPNVLVLGGVGFIGRNLVSYLIKNDLAAKIRVCDKVLPPTAFLGNPHKADFENAIVEYKQCNLGSQAGVEKAFALEGGKFQWVFNLASETKYGQTEDVYKEKVLELITKIGQQAASHGPDKFVQVSTAQVYDHGKKQSKEDGKISPWTLQAKYMLQAENALKAMSGLNLIIIRPSTVYGPGDTAGISPRIIIAAVYKHLNERMKLLWDGSLRINTVHVDDVCKALHHAAARLNAGAVYNVSDKNDSSQEKINKVLESIFGIKTGFHGAMISNLAKVNLKAATEQVNDKHLKPWSDICKADSIVNTPLTPYIDTELLLNHALAVDGSAIESTGFSYDHPNLTEQLIRDQIKYFVEQQLFPASVVPK